MKKLFAFLLIGGITLILITCAKEYSFEGGKGGAAFIFAGAPGQCTQSTVSGDFYADTLLTPNNTVSLMVDVTAPGAYNISTNTNHGISFSVSGNFVDTGIQKITLTGVGIPDTIGAVVINIPGNTGCSFTINVVDAAPADFVLSGSPDNCTNPDIKGDYVAGTDMVSSNTININVTVNKTGPYTVTTDTVDGISFSASGRFTATGNQQITLKGSGKPDEPGIEYFTLKAAASRCTFPVRIINSPPWATYVLESGYGVPYSTCICTVNGDYFSNTPLSTPQAVEMRVYVSEPGNFTISTERINGMMFSLTGTFTAGGAQYVTLEGSGTPVNPGTYTFIPEIVGPAPIGGNTCAFDVTVH